MKNHLLKILILFPLTIFSQAGVGTTSPDASSKLDVTAADKGVLIPRVSITDLNTAAPVTSPVESLLVYNTKVSTGVGFYYWDGSKWTPISGTAGTDTDWTISGDDMYNANTGYVGVGTTTPSILMHIEDTGAPAIRIVDGNEAAGLVLTSDASGYVSWGQPILDDDWTISGNDMYNANSGNVEIGSIVSKSNPAKFAIQTDRILLESAGNAVLCGKISSFFPARAYEFIGMYTDAGFDQNAIYIGGYNANNAGGSGFDDANQIHCGKTSSSTNYIPITATSFNVASSRNYKKNISTLNYGLNDILKIKPVKYQYKNDKNGLYTVGFIAEQVSEIIPEVVQHEDEKGNIVSREEGRPVSMDYSKMNAVLINAVKEQQAEIDILEKENLELTTQISKLERLLL